MTTAAIIYDVLGGPGVFHQAAPGLAQFRTQIRAGLPYSALESVMARFELGREEIAAALHLPQRTLARRKKEGRLHPDESDRLFRLVRIAAHATECLGSREKASHWLQRSNRALGGAVPLELLDTDAGARQVEEILGRIEHGVYS